MSKVTPTPFRLEEYVDSYRGINRILRLKYIASQFEQHRPHALGLALQFLVNETQNVNLFEEILYDLPEGTKMPDMKDDWVAKTKSDNNEVITRLDQTQKTLAANFMHRELAPIYGQLADFYIMTGDYGMAQRYLDKQRSYDQSLYNNDEFTVKMAESAFLQENWSLVRTIAAKKLLEEEATPANTRLGVLLGISYLRDHMYQECVGTLLKIWLPDVMTNGMFQGLSTDSDLAMYIAVCGLATLSRNNLKYLVVKDPVFRQLAENTGYLTQMLDDFLNLEYKSFFTLWESYYNTFAVDLYLGPVIKLLEAKIFQRAYMDYLTPFSLINMARMESVFGRQIADELPDVIRHNRLNFKLDLNQGTVVHIKPDPATEVFTKAETVAERYLINSKSLLWSTLSLKCSD